MDSKDIIKQKVHGSLFYNIYIYIKVSAYRVQLVIIDVQEAKAFNIENWVHSIVLWRQIHNLIQSIKSESPTNRSVSCVKNCSSFVLASSIKTIDKGKHAPQSLCSETPIFMSE